MRLDKALRLSLSCVLPLCKESLSTSSQLDGRRAILTSPVGSLATSALTTRKPSFRKLPRVPARLFGANIVPKHQSLPSLTSIQATLPISMVNMSLTAPAGTVKTGGFTRTATSTERFPDCRTSADITASFNLAVKTASRSAGESSSLLPPVVDAAEASCSLAAASSFCEVSSCCFCSCCCSCCRFFSDLLFFFFLFFVAVFASSSFSSSPASSSSSSSSHSLLTSSSCWVTIRGRSSFWSSSSCSCSCSCSSAEIAGFCNDDWFTA
mmetsp:Transcript_88520/g.185001  ORF Transcript_88520/g.185001 Transcript_88520/m.185001 type:complete len:267 (-) Transcript_88520:129-929(-)